VDWSRYFHLSLSDFQSLISRRTVILTVMAIIIYQGVGIFYQTLTLQLIRMRPAPAAESVQAAAVPIREPADAYRVIPERNLFDTTTKTAGDKQVVAVQQDIALAIDLRGTIAGGAKYGFAVVEEKGTQKQRLVKAGDIVAGAKVVRITRNAVDFLVGNQERTLKIAETKEAPILPPSQGGTASTGPPLPPPSGSVVINRSEIGESLKDMGSLLRQAQIRPYFNAGVPDGFIINSIRRGSLYQKMGIVNGDIIQEVNSRKIQTADDITGLLNAMRSGSSLSLTVKRGGKQEMLNYQFQ
jgi:type II secretion system protein C